jgi:hypothetical protein
VSAVLFAHLSPASAEEASLQIMPYYWNAELSGDGHTGQGNPIQEFDVADTLQVDTGESVPSVEFFIRFGMSRAIFGWNRGSYSGGGNLDADLEYDGLTFPQGGRVHSEFDFDRKRLVYGRPFTNGKKMAGGLLFGIDAYKIDSSVQMSGVGQREVNLDATLPVIGASIVYFPAPTFRVYGEFYGMYLNQGGTNSRIVEAYTDIEYYFIGQSFGLTFGYRYCHLEAEDEGEARFDLKQLGPFTGIVIRF